MNVYLKDILDQPESLEASFNRFLSGPNLQLIKSIAEEGCEKVIFTGMGSSHYACCCASIHLNQNGFTSMVKSASQLLHYEFELLGGRTLLFLVSQSGESAEIVNILRKLPDAARVVAITNDPASTLAKRGNYTFLLNVAEEESVTTRTYLASMLILDVIAKFMTGQFDENEKKHILNIISELRKFLANYKEIAKKISGFIDRPGYICVIGRGYSHSTVFSGSLFIKEVARFPSIGMDSGEFRHGPFEMVDESFVGIVIAPRGAAYEMNAKMSISIAERGGRVIFVTSKGSGMVKHRNVLVIEMEPIEEFYSPLIDVVPVQLAANCIAESKNLEVGKFRWSSKITAIE
jgi:glucosamine--fructose-6-phosphate aminotransferase (isomerizing)